ncbi:DUF429 domain-containing protein [Calidifontibacter sp. DB0510]|uniref:DUF429 domain-containing protein n=1 Tax=Metallococcus carri TaxID=1656884 RepID=A0A967AYI5_9MICO|nr:DUF429 domain-containing protein [Metallococcus carri]NOP36456.1 DUF429 domain-containing protein [Calidifontibacter sp. DB2511S]
MLGVDACTKGWVGASSDVRVYFGVTIDKLVATAEADGPPLAVVAIDIPIGLPTSGPREADRLARSLVGKRWQSVFGTPIRAALEAATHAEATALSLAATGKGISQQAHRLGPKILEVDTWTRATDRTVIEAHPEVSFATIAGHPLEHPKSTWSGAQERLALLAAVGIVLPADVGEAGAMAAVDDVLDAAVVSWTAARYASGTAVSYPTTPETIGDEPCAVIWA